MLSSHHILTNIIQTKQALYGGGCSESMQILYLKSQINNFAVHYVINIIRNVIRAQNNSDYVIDRIHGHLWYISDNNQISEKCSCELYSTTNRFENEWKNFCFYLDDEKQEEEKLNDNNELFIKQIYPKYLDSFHMRTNAFRTAIETAINLHLTSICL